MFDVPTRTLSFCAFLGENQLKTRNIIPTVFAYKNSNTYTAVDLVLLPLISHWKTLSNINNSFSKIIASTQNLQNFCMDTTVV